MKRFLSTILVLILLLSAICTSTLSDGQVTMYAPDGRIITVAESEVMAYEKVGWYKEPVQVLYAEDGRSAVFAKSQVAAQCTVGWYTTPVTTYSSYTNVSQTVYVTRTGSKYHRYGCQYLRKSCYARSLSSAKTSGYTPCSRCNPPR